MRSHRKFTYFTHFIVVLFFIIILMARYLNSVKNSHIELPNKKWAIKTEIEVYTCFIPKNAKQWFNLSITHSVRHILLDIL